MHCASGYMFLTSLLMVLRTHRMGAAAEESLEFHNKAPVRLVWATEGDNVELPCDITPPRPEDSVNMVLWFKDNAGIPLYRRVSLHFKNNLTPIRLFLRGASAYRARTST
ncbi:uncharacterized protein LOC118648607 [Monomorium pharaonis]|uniref:uncharacterized protein LOC118648607 n=1 Tax=Monomorium pharaonis TaxID=307658 RepID=UPI0017461D85|nr:uncharacterized protein LOC118648607 [Monomorium pharaonis]